MVFSFKNVKKEKKRSAHLRSFHEPKHLMGRNGGGRKKKVYNCSSVLNKNLINNPTDCRKLETLPETETSRHVSDDGGFLALLESGKDAVRPGVSAPSDSLRFISPAYPARLLSPLREDIPALMISSTRRMLLAITVLKKRNEKANYDSKLLVIEHKAGKTFAFIYLEHARTINRVF